MKERVRKTKIEVRGRKRERIRVDGWMHGWMDGWM